MPVYLVHGFRWPRAGFSGIRVHAIAHNLEDCSVEYIQNEPSKITLLQSFRTLYPEIMQHLEDKRTGRTLDFIEQYNPEDESIETAVTQPHAFVADRVVTIAARSDSMPVSKDKHSETNTATAIRPSSASTPAKPSTSSSAASSHLVPHNTSALYLNVEQTMSNGPVVTPEAWEALAQLRDKIAEGEKIGWWIVYNGDPERSFDDDDDDEDNEDGDEKEIESETGEEEENEDDDGQGTPTQENSFLKSGVLGQPLPTLIPPGMKGLVVNKSNQETSETAKMSTSKEDEKATPSSTPPQSLANAESPSSHSPGKPGGSGTSKSNKSNFTSNFSFPLRRKSSKVNIPSPKGEDIPDPPALKEINKKEGRRYRFFGGKSDKKAT